jgi:hypothetical protein
VRGEGSFDGFEGLGAGDGVDPRAQPLGLLGAAEEERAR